MPRTLLEPISKSTLPYVYIHTYCAKLKKKGLVRTNFFFCPHGLNVPQSVSQSPMGAFAPMGDFGLRGIGLGFFCFFFLFSPRGVGWGWGGGGRAYWLGYIAYRGTNQQKRKERGRTSRCFGPSYLYLIEFNE